MDLGRKPAIAHLRGEATKTGHSRIGFLSSETATLIGYYLKVRRNNHQYLFDGFEPHERGKNRDVDRPMSKNSAWGCVRRAFRRVEMNQRSPQGHYYHHPNVLRTLSLALMKTGGFPPDWAEYVIGHSLGTQASYMPPTETLGREWLKIEHRFCFLGNPLTYEGPVGSLTWNPEGARRDNMDRPADSSANAIPLMKASQADEGSATQRWVSNSYYYVKTNISSSDYDQALADSYSLFDSRADGLRVLRKRRVVSV